MALYARPNKRSRGIDFIMGVGCLIAGAGVMDNGEHGLGMILLSLGGLAVLFSVFPFWRRVR